MARSSCSTRSGWWTCCRRWRRSPWPAPPRRAVCCRPPAPPQPPGASLYSCSNSHQCTNPGATKHRAMALLVWLIVARCRRTAARLACCRRSSGCKHAAWVIPCRPGPDTAVLCVCSRAPASSQQQRRARQQEAQRQQEAAGNGFGGWPTPFGFPPQLPLPSPAAFLGAPAAALLFPPPLQVR